MMQASEVVQIVFLAFAKQKNWLAAALPLDGDGHGS
jgi:hypothetical protein